MILLKNNIYNRGKSHYSEYYKNQSRFEYFLLSIIGYSINNKIIKIL